MLQEAILNQEYGYHLDSIKDFETELKLKFHPCLKHVYLQDLTFFAFFVPIAGLFFFLSARTTLLQ